MTERVWHREETTNFTSGKCACCGGATFNTYENGVACDGCGRRVVATQRRLTAND
jgi:DNA-directed RNA polymerase subunit RPC12/RpoP